MWLLQSKPVESLEMWSWRKVLWISWATKMTNKWIIDQIIPEFFLDAKMTKLRQSHLSDIMRLATGKDCEARKS